MSLIDLSIVRGADGFYHVIDYRNFQVAANTTIGAYGAHFFVGNDGF